MDVKVDDLDTGVEAQESFAVLGYEGRVGEDDDEGVRENYR